MVLFVPVSALAFGAAVDSQVTLQAPPWMLGTNRDQTKGTYTTGMPHAKRSATRAIAIPTFFARTTDHILGVTRLPAFFTHAPL